MYKPHRAGVLHLLAAARGLVDEDGSFFGPLYPVTVARPTHLWQERVEHTDIADTDSAATYYCRFGRVAALLTMLGASDLHHENVIAVSGGPVVIDAETLVSIRVLADAGGADGLARDVEASVLNTLLFPARFPGRLDVDMSAIGCQPWDESQVLQTSVVVDAGTDTIRFDRVPVIIAHGANVATMAGSRLDPRMWVDEVTAGFHEARERLRTHRAAIENVITQAPGWTVRHMLRPTYVYGQFLEASTHPAYLASTADRVSLLSKLPRSLRGARETVADELHREEVEALLQLDVPYFEVDADSRDLRCNGETVVANAVPSTPRVAALTSIGEFFDRPPGRDLAYIRYALASSVNDPWQSSRVPRRTGPRRPGSAAPVLTDPAGWHESIRDMVVEGKDGPTWLMPQLDGERMHLAPVNALLHEGGGLLVYLAAVEAAGEVAVLEAAIGKAYAYACPRELPETTTPLSVSPFTGTLSTIVTWWELRWRGAAADVSQPAVDRSAGHKIDVDGMSAGDLDYLNGFGGYLVYLAEYADHGAPRLDGLAPERLLARLIQVDGPPEHHSGTLGLAHGRFGRIAAMSALVGRDGSPSGRIREHLERFASAYLRNRWTDEVLQDASMAASWCKGYAGIAFAATKLLRAVGHSLGDIRDMIAPEVERVINSRLEGDISFCHGVSGRLAMLCWLADHLCWPELRTEARALNTRFVEQYADSGWSCGIGSTQDIPCFLFGLSGWYFVQLTLADPSIELPLSLGAR